MTTEPKTQIKKPKGLSAKSAKTAMKKVVKDNQEWLKEMANR